MYISYKNNFNLRYGFDKNESHNISEIIKITGFMQKLSELNTDDLEPLIFMTEESGRLREDETVVTITQTEALHNAPKKDSDYFRIPKVLDK
jgi:aspartyl-tRNA(Asn)/glutamyl-tRNA(Gln) amidotransferase subunit C